MPQRGRDVLQVGAVVDDRDLDQRARLARRRQASSRRAARRARPGPRTPSNSTVRAPGHHLVGGARRAARAYAARERAAALSATSASSARRPTGAAPGGPRAQSGAGVAEPLEIDHEFTGRWAAVRRLGLRRPRGLSRVRSGRGEPADHRKGEGPLDGMSIKRALGFEAEVVTPTSTGPALRPRRPRHRADAASCLAVWIFVPVRPRSPTGKPVVDRSCEESPGGMSTKRPSGRGGDDTHLSGQLLRLPPSPSSGRRRELPRGVELSLLSGSLFHLRQAGCGPDPGHLRPKPAVTRVPCRLRRTVAATSGPAPRPASRLRTRSPPWTGRADPKRKQGEGLSMV